jgi:hypothetical protein
MPNVQQLGALLLSEILDSDTSNEEEEMGLKHQKKKRKGREFNAKTALQSIFSVRYLKPADECQDHLSATSIFNDNSCLGKVFRHRFRIPYSMFVHLCQRYAGEADYRKSHDATGKQKMHDVRLLALGAIRLIARDLVFDALEELNGISSTANRAFFFSFVPWLAGLSSSFIVLPRTVDELQHVSDLYRIVGLPGCAGSADCVHTYFGIIVQRIYRAAARGRRSSHL